jgi:hypothetical protein
MSDSKFYQRLAWFSAFIFGAIALTQFLFPILFDFTFLYISSILITILTFFVYQVCKIGVNSSDDQQLGNSFTWITGVKMGAAILFFLIYHKFIHQVTKYDVLFFFGIYALFIAFELFSVIKMIKKA